MCFPFRKTFPKLPSPEDIGLSHTEIYRTGQPRRLFPLLAVMRSCNSLSVSSARSHSLSLSLSKLRQLAYKIADSIIQLYNQDNGDAHRKKGAVKANVKDSLGNSSRMFSNKHNSHNTKVGRSKIVIHTDCEGYSEADLLYARSRVTAYKYNRANS